MEELVTLKESQVDKLEGEKREMHHRMQVIEQQQVQENKEREEKRREMEKRYQKEISMLQKEIN